MIFGRACLKGLDNPPEDWPPVRLVAQKECFHLVASATLVDDAIARGAYLITPGWLDDWRGNLRRLGFDEGGAAGFFHDFARELLLLDTGVIQNSSLKLAELADAVKLPASSVAVGIDYTRLLLARLVAEWRLEGERKQAQERDHRHARELADHISAMDFLGRLAQLKDEHETIAAIEEMFRMLFAPQEFHYVRFEGGVAQFDEALPELSSQVRALHDDRAWSASGTGFLLRISSAGEPLGVVAADGFAFPEFRDSYLNLALSIAGVCALAIENARAYRRIKEVEDALREFNATLEQRVAEEVAKNTEQERLLIQQSRLAAMGEMIGNIAHQWRQPLSALSLLITNIKEDYEFHELTPKSLGDAIGRAQNLLRRMSSTIDDFRDFFKPNREKTVFSLRAVVENVMEIIGSSLSAHNIKVDQKITDDALVCGFPNEFAQVLLNIMTNAKEAIISSDRKDGLIEIRGERTDGQATLSVKNNGGWIPEDILPKIFDVYFTTKGTGTGIGLYMSRMIVENHLSGRIEARNLQEGVEFIVTCPVATPVPGRPTRAEKKS
ncbi:hypothetical protein SKTS_17810 [Sulfurimicrobium lacus]|uniref:histidine kinase n=2 Tax=Sulfurimicrobium lacus TaxID=2715678 RepID=A0A6F8VDQ4_9PROT|nr:hypothetical protein SKTS_17810 [Sulfurimicrobium lacus]